MCKDSSRPSIPETDLPSICIVVTTFYAGGVLATTLESVSSLRYPKNKIQVMVVRVPDDEEAAVHVHRHDGNLRLFSVNDDNADVRRNYGARQCESDLVLALDDDIVVDENLLVRSVGIMSKNFRIAAIAYPTLSTSFGLAEKLNHGRFLGAVVQANTVSPCTLFRRAVLEKVGFYREDMGPPCSIHEDWELGSRLRKNGFGVVFDGNLTMKHLHEATIVRGGVTEGGVDARSEMNPKPLALAKMVWEYAQSYRKRHWWSMFQVLAASPRAQLAEYMF